MPLAWNVCVEPREPESFFCNLLDQAAFKSSVESLCECSTFMKPGVLGSSHGLDFFEMVKKNHSIQFDLDTLYVKQPTIRVLLPLLCFSRGKALQAARDAARPGLWKFCGRWYRYGVYFFT